MRKGTIIGIFLLAFCLACRLFVPVADFYAVHIYPAVSYVLSLAGSIFPFSLEEIVVLGFVTAFVIITIMAIRVRQKFTIWLKKTLVVAMWCTVWSCMGWGNNYHRTNLYQRNDIHRVSYDGETFRQFLTDFTQELNEAASEAGTYERESLEAEAKTFYSNTVRPYGYNALRSWQHVKKPILNRLFSAVSVSGYMGPFFCETQVNSDVHKEHYPYVMAHELAHLAGVTSEAEASYWGFSFCRQSDNNAIRYSGFLNLFPYVLTHARSFLTEEEYSAWIATVCNKAKEDFTDNQEFWKEKRVIWISSIQRRLQDLMLKSGGVSEGVSDYFGVLSFVITMDAATDNYRQ